MWNTRQAALQYDHWYDSPRGAFALTQETRLLQKMLSAWPRRGHSLLEVGCGTGRFLEFFWENGFDATGCDRSPAMLEVCRERLGSRVDLHLGAADLLPFDDNSFDYAAVITVLEYMDDPSTAMAEALRVAAKGVILGFLNRWSLYYLCKGLPWPSRAGILHRLRWRSWWSYHLLARSLQPGCATAIGTTLSGPPCTWRANMLCCWCNSVPRFLPIGGFGVLRIDLRTLRAGTPLGLRIGSLPLKNASPATAMEHARQRLHHDNYRSASHSTPEKLV